MLCSSVSISLLCAHLGPIFPTLNDPQHRIRIQCFACCFMSSPRTPASGTASGQPGVSPSQHDVTCHNQQLGTALFHGSCTEQTEPTERGVRPQAVQLLRRAVHLHLRLLLPAVPVRAERGSRGGQRLRHQLPGARRTVSPSVLVVVAAQAAHAVASVGLGAHSEAPYASLCVESVCQTCIVACCRLRDPAATLCPQSLILARMCTRPQIYCCLAQFCLQWIVHTQSRERLRNKYGLEAAPCSDCCVTFWCARWLRHLYFGVLADRIAYHESICIDGGREKQHFKNPAFDATVRSGLSVGSLQSQVSVQQQTRCVAALSAGVRRARSARRLSNRR